MYSTPQSLITHHRAYCNLTTEFMSQSQSFSKRYIQESTLRPFFLASLKLTIVSRVIAILFPVVPCDCLFPKKYTILNKFGNPKQRTSLNLLSTRISPTFKNYYFILIK